MIAYPCTCPDGLGLHHDHDNGPYSDPTWWDGGSVIRLWVDWREVTRAIADASPGDRGNCVHVPTPTAQGAAFVSLVDPDPCWCGCHDGTAAHAGPCSCERTNWPTPAPREESTMSEPAFRALPGDPDGPMVEAMFDIRSEDWILASNGTFQTAALEAMRDDGSGHQVVVALEWPGRRNHTDEQVTVRLLMSPEDAEGLADVLEGTGRWLRQARERGAL